MKSERNSLSERLLDFGVNVINLANQLNKTATGRHIAGQLIRSGTSSGANYEEGCGAESRVDFVHKLQLSLKELRESSYWLRLIKKANLIPEADPELTMLLKEAVELTNIIGKSIVTAKKNRY